MKAMGKSLYRHVIPQRFVMVPEHGKLCSNISDLILCSAMLCTLNGGNSYRPNNAANRLGLPT